MAGRTVIIIVALLFVATFCLCGHVTALVKSGGYGGIPIDGDRMCGRIRCINMVSIKNPVLSEVETVYGVLSNGGALPGSEMAIRRMARRRFLHCNVYDAMIIYKIQKPSDIAELRASGATIDFEIGDTIMHEIITYENVLNKGIVNLIIHNAAQQVDSAEASTIAVPPSGPSGSPR